MTAASDQQVIEKVLQGDRRAYALLIDRYKDMVFTLTLRMLRNREEAEETAQDTFIKIFKSLPNFKGSSKLSTWVYKIAYNTCLDQLKKGKNKFATEDIDEINESNISSVNTIFETLEVKEQQKLIRHCLQLLPGDDSFFLTLFYFEDLSIDEIASVAGIKSNNVKIKLYRGRKKLGEILRKHLEKETIESYERT